MRNSRFARYATACALPLIVWTENALGYPGLVFPGKSPDSCYQCSGGRNDGVPSAPALPQHALDFSNGTRLFEAGLYQDAFPYLRRAAELEPQNVKYQRWLAECYVRLGQDQQALTILDRLLSSPNVTDDVIIAVTADKNSIQAKIRQQSADEAARSVDQMVADAQTKSARIAAEARRIDLIVAKARIDALTEQAEAENILRGVRRIVVPPPIPPEKVRLSLGQLPPRDPKSEKLLNAAGILLLGAELGVKIGAAPLLWTKVILIPGEALIADLDGAHIYVARKGELYDRALNYLKDPKTRKEFAEVLGRLRNNQQLPSENTSIDMARAAQALLEPRLGGGSASLVWDAMMSPEARNAMVTRFAIGLASEVVGAATSRYVDAEMASRDTAVTKAVDFLSHSKVALMRVKDPVAVKSLYEARKLANEIIAKSYESREPARVGMGALESWFAGSKLEEGREISAP